MVVPGRTASALALPPTERHIVDTEDERFKTNQTTLAAFFTYNDLAMVDLAWKHGSCAFFFEDNVTLRRLFTQYNAGKGLVEPQEFMSAYTQVKNKMFQARDQAALEDR